MIWNCDGEIRKIEFEYFSILAEQCCYIERVPQSWETGWRNAGPWDWLRKGYTIEFSEWVEI